MKTMESAKRKRVKCPGMSGWAKLIRSNLVWEVTVRNSAEAKQKLFGVNHPAEREENQARTVTHGRPLHRAMKNIHNGSGRCWGSRVQSKLEGRLK